MFTADSHALRVWSTKKQLKAVRRDEESKGRVLVQMSFLERMGCIMLVTSTKSGETTGGCLQFWQPSLTLIQNVRQLSFKNIKSHCISLT